MLAEVIITVASLEEGVAFYTEAVGLDYLRRVRVDDQAVVLLASGATRVALVEGPVAGIRLAFSTGDVGSDHRRLIRGNVPMATEPTRARGGTVLPFNDPWGNALAFWEAS